MSVKQISIFIENKTGKLAELTKFIADNNINIRALSIADATEFGILRIITEKPDEAAEIIKNGGFIAKKTVVLAVEIDDTPGSMSKILEVLSNADISIEYTYAFISAKTSGACMIFRVNDNDKAKKVLTEAGIHVVEKEDIF